MAGPNYIYTSDTPNSPDPMNNTQPIILSNFKAIYEFMAVNHVPFNTPDTFGRHFIVKMQVQSDDPDTGSNDLTLYSKYVTSGENTAELFIRYPNNGSILQISNVVSGAVGTSGPGYCIFPGGLIIKWGAVSYTYNASSNSGNVMYFYYPKGDDIPAFTQAIGSRASAITSNQNQMFYCISSSSEYFTVDGSASFSLNYLSFGQGS